MEKSVVSIALQMSAYNESGLAEKNGPTYSYMPCFVRDIMGTSIYCYI